MDFAALFHTLLTRDQQSSSLTVKNYVSDLRNFTRWYESKYHQEFDPSQISRDVITAFRNDAALAPASQERRLAALKKFLTLLSREGMTVTNPFTATAAHSPTVTDKWYVKEFSHYLKSHKSSPVTVKNYTLDIIGFQKWFTLTYQSDDVKKAGTRATIDEYKYRLIHVLRLSPASVNRKMSSLRKYFDFLQIHTTISNLPEKAASATQMISLQDLDGRSNHDYSAFPPIRLFQKLAEPLITIENTLADRVASAIRTQSYTQEKNSTVPTQAEIRNIPKSFFNPQGISTKHFSPRQKFVHHLKYSRPAWYKKYHMWSYTPTIHIALFMVFCSAVAVYVYGSFQKDTMPGTSILGAQQDNSRILTFSGILKNAQQKVLTERQRVSFRIYSTSEAPSAPLWEEVRTVIPDENGRFSVALGELQPISKDLFTSGNSLFLGVTVGNSPELRPRQPIANTQLSANTERIQDMLPITDSRAGSRNVLLALNSSGDLQIGGTSSPTFQATDGDFTLSGNAVVLQTNPGTAGNIILAPDDLGVIDVQAPLMNTTTLNDDTSSISILDSVVINASDSAQTALSITTSGTGDLLNLGSFGNTHLSVKSSGNIGIGTDQPTSLLDVRGTLSVSGSTRFNNLNYSWPTASGSKGSVLTTDGSGMLTWASPDTIGNAYFSLNNGAIHTRSTHQDLLIGGSSTESAKFGFTNLGSGTPTATFSGNLMFSGNRTIAAVSLASLTLGDNQTGAITFQNAGNVGIGVTNPSFKFEVKDIKDSTVITRFYNASTGGAADGIAIRLGNNSATTPSTNTFIKFETDGLGVVGAISGNGSGGVTFATNGPADFAEYLKKDPSEHISYGTLVCLASSSYVTACAENDHVIGVATRNPAFVGGTDLGNRSIAVGLVGQINVLIDPSTEAIEPGDPIAPSINGTGKKATQPQFIVGRALESSTQSPDGTVLVLVQPSWFEPRLSLNATGQPSVPTITAVSQLNPVLDYPTGGYIVRQAGAAITRIGTFAQASIGSLYAGMINAQEVIISGTLQAQNIVTKQLSVSSDNLLVSGKTLRQYIVDTVKSSGELFNNPTGRPQVYGDTVITTMISPLAEDAEIAVTLSNDTLTVLNGASATASAVASIDHEGNASFSGSLSAADLQTGNATVSGTLHADTIVARSILGLDEQVASAAARIMTNSQPPIATTAAQPESFALASLPKDFVNIGTMSASFAMIQDNLLSMGTATLREATILDGFSIGTGFVFSTNSMNTLGQDLEIQPLRQGRLNLMAGSFIIDTDGTIMVNENARFAKNVSVDGTLAANIIAPLPEEDLTLSLDQKSSGESQSIHVRNGSKTPVFSINDDGDVISSGSAIFARDLVASGSALLSKLNIFSAQVEAVSDVEVIASGSAGLAEIKQGRREITVNTPAVTQDSLIYITPIGNTNNQVLYLSRQVPGKSFTVSISETARTTIPFNWMIVN